MKALEPLFKSFTRFKYSVRFVSSSCRSFTYVHSAAVKLPSYGDGKSADLWSKCHPQFVRCCRYHSSKQGIPFEEERSETAELDQVEDEVEEDEEATAELAEKLLKDDTYDACLREYCQLPDAGHKVFILQIVEQGKGEKHPETYGELKLAENIALVKSVPGWSIVDTMIVKAPEKLLKYSFIGQDLFEEAKDRILETRGVSALVVCTSQLSAMQTFEMQEMFHMPVFNRSFMIIQAFKSQAKSKDAKIKVALAELPHARFQFGLNRREARNFFMTAQGNFFIDRERRLKATLMALNKQKNMLREHRRRRKIPTISVIGYTNCGKTTLIKALTGDEDMMPENRLFATLDVTAHGGTLPNHMSVIFIDTVGFISELPVRLKEAFTATLEDTIAADLVVHVTDRSNPDYVGQQQNVHERVSSILGQKHMDSMIQVYNKADLLDSWDKDGNVESHYISSVTGEGLDALRELIQDRLLDNIDYVQKKIKIPFSGQHLGWLRKEATIVSTEQDDDPENMIVNVHISNENYSKFLARFSNKKLKSSKHKRSRS